MKMLRAESGIIYMIFIFQKKNKNNKSNHNLSNMVFIIYCEREPYKLKINYNRELKYIFFYKPLTWK